MARPPRGDSLRRVHCGSAPLGRDLWRKIGGWAHGAEVINTYGITETASWLAGSLGDGEPEDGLIGHGWGSQLRIGRQPEACPTIAEACPTGETGYVWSHTAKLMKGYFHRDDLTTAAGGGGEPGLGGAGAALCRMDRRAAAVDAPAARQPSGALAASHSHCDAPLLGRGDTRGYLSLVSARVIYCALLAAGLSVSFARSLRKPPAAGRTPLVRRAAQTLAVGTFFALLHV